MFFPKGQVRVFLYGQPVKMRLSFDGLYALAKNVMHQDPLSGNLSRSLTARDPDPRPDRSSLCVWAKRLEQGRFVSNLADVESREMDWTGLKLLLEGIEPRQVRKRYKKPLSRTQNELRLPQRPESRRMSVHPRTKSRISSMATMTRPCSLTSRRCWSSSSPLPMTRRQDLIRQTLR